MAAASGASLRARDGNARPLGSGKRAECILGGKRVDVLSVAHEPRHFLSCARLRCSQTLIVPTG